MDLKEYKHNIGQKQSELLEETEEAGIADAAKGIGL